MHNLTQRVWCATCCAATDAAVVETVKSVAVPLMSALGVGTIAHAKGRFTTAPCTWRLASSWASRHGGHQRESGVAVAVFRGRGP